MRWGSFGSERDGIYARPATAEKLYRPMTIL